MVGGVLEYLSRLTGYQALLILVGALYALAYLLARRFRFLADRDLEIARGVGGEEEAVPAPAFGK